MASTDMGKQQIRQHTVHMEQRRQVLITGVSDVCSFHETEIVLKVDNGVMLVTGEALHVDKLLLDEGKLDVEGQIDGIIYEKKRVSNRRLRFWKREPQ